MIQFKYRLDTVNWVDLISITPINKINSYYDGLNIVIQNETKWIILYVNSRNKLISEEIEEHSFKTDILCQEQI